MSTYSSPPHPPGQPSTMVISRMVTMVTGTDLPLDSRCFSSESTETILCVKRINLLNSE